MKHFVLIIMSLATTKALACTGEAQIIAKVGSIEKTMTSCTARLDSSSIRFYAENGTCPLDIDEVLAQGIEVGLKDGHDCRFDVGSELSGVLVKNSAGRLVLE